MVQKSAHLQPGFSAGLGLFGAGLPSVYIFYLLSAGFSSFKCRFCPFRCRFCLFKCWFCLLGRKRERLKLSGNPLRAVLWNVLRAYNTSAMKMLYQMCICVFELLLLPLGGCWEQSLEFGERLRGNRNRGNRPKRFWEGNLPLKGSLRGGVFRSFQRFSEILTGLQSLVAHDCGYPLSRYTCRATRVAANFLDFIAFCRCSTGVALQP